MTDHPRDTIHTGPVAGNGGSTRARVPQTPRSIPPWFSSLLFIAAAAPAVAFGIGGIPHTARAGLAAGGLSSLAVVAASLVAGHAPYSQGLQGTVPFIYPPGMVAFILAPLFAGKAHYVLAFAVEMVVLILVAVPLVESYRKRIAPGQQALGWSLLAVLGAVGPLTLYRADPAIGLLLVAAAIAWRQGNLTGSFLLVFAAGLIKDYAWVELLPLAATQLKTAINLARPWPARLWEALRPPLLGFLPTGALLVGVDIWSSGGLLRSQLHNFDRGLEIESVPATLGMLLTHLKGLIVTRGALGSMQISGQGLHPALLATTFAALGVLLLMLIAGLCLTGPISPGVAFAATLGVAIIATPVLSPQYFDALLPCLCLAAAELGGLVGPYLLWGSVSLGLLTQLEFPYLWTSVLHLSPLGLLALAARNLLLITVVIALLVIGVLRRRYAPTTAGGLGEPVPRGGATEG